MALRRCLRPATLSTISLRSHLPVAPVADNGSIALIAASAQAAAINLRLPRAPAYPVLASTSLAPSTIVAVALNAPVSTVEVPRLDASTEAIVHEETSPAVDIGGMTVTPTRSYFQSDTVGLRLRWPISWALRDPRGIAWILKMDDDERADILYTAYDTLEASADLDEQIAARDPDHPDALEHWQSLRERYRKPSRRHGSAASILRPSEIGVIGSAGPTAALARR